MSPANQNPVFTDNETITGDGTVENPLAAVGGGGPTPNLLFAAVRQANGPVVITGDGSFQTVISSGAITKPDANHGVLCFASFLVTPQTGNTQMLWKFERNSDASIIGEEGGENSDAADGTKFYARQWMAFTQTDWTDGDSVNLVLSGASGDVDVTGISLAVFFIPVGF